MSDGRLDATLDQLIESQSYGKAPRTGGPIGLSGQRVQPYGGRGGAGGGGGGAPRGAPRGPPQGGARISETLDDTATPQNAIKVGGNQDAKDIAHRICESCRVGDPPALLTIGGQSINQAVKAIAIARADLCKEGLQLSFQPAFRHTDRTKPLIAFYVAKERAPRQQITQGDDVTLTVASGSKIVPVAGAIAGKIRENLKISLLAIGVDAVTNAVLAVGNARLFLEQDNYDIRVEPEFEKVEKNGQVMTSMKLSLVAEAL
ncbi:hypothetical protein CHLRE_09g393350v5 [Chlamydomonas reinhardtii]|uniref:Uncharacterized protein n=1 Tax=Chlamydomonas reinhardtii TaxID=3055 RepID=A8IZU4_CHLRE|nr:uncharacterized protein CHLRE_09g393350v5 [Chlamydomonas reinhardtii]PNW78533.1 hypothetical protein CHLRE_09g393350v5 [Chlamydomonas reinhardtii]|eukprot:XP_001694588.1 predicted protein [Chlamydomonas reinhardtii]